MDAADLIKKHEGLRLVCYDDATGAHVVPGYTMVGHPTIGYGRALDTDGILPSEAAQWVANELPHREADLMVIFGPRWAALGTARQAALLDMHYTLGPGGFREFHEMITALGNQNWAAAQTALLASKWARDEAPERAQEDAQLLLEGVFPS